MLRFELHRTGAPDAQFSPRSLSIEEQGREVLLRFGKEPRLRTTRRSFSSEYEARSFVAVIAKTHLAADYVQAPAHGHILAPSEDVLVARMAAGDEDAYVVYADALLERGDPRGELIALFAKDPGALRLRAEFQSWLANYTELLAGPLAARLPHLQATWRLGFLESIRVAFDYIRDREDFSAASLLAAAFHHPSTRFLRGLAVGSPGRHRTGYEDVLATIAAVGPDALRTLSIGELDAHNDWVPDPELGDASDLWLALPYLDDVTFEGSALTLGVMHAPTLRRLTIRTRRFPMEPLRAIVRAALPNLEQLEIWIGDTNFDAGTTREDLERLLLRGVYPRLVHLALCNASIADEICALVIRSPTAHGLRVLDLSNGTLGDASAYALIQARDQLPNLGLLDVSENCLSETACRHLGDVFPKVRCSAQKHERRVSLSERTEDDW
jgi:uncharacterized protein (TIGR02996 family)